MKSLTQEASIGISQASVVETDEKLRERVHFIHDSVGTDAIVERYIRAVNCTSASSATSTLKVSPSGSCTSATCHAKTGASRPSR